MSFKQKKNRNKQRIVIFGVSAWHTLEHVGKQKLPLGKIWNILRALDFLSQSSELIEPAELVSPDADETHEHARTNVM